MPVSEHAYHMGGSQIWLEPGEQFTLDEMLRAICVSSANDAAVAVAELVGGSEPVFVEQMTPAPLNWGCKIPRSGRLRAGRRGASFHRAGCGGAELLHPEHLPGDPALYGDLDRQPAQRPDPACEHEQAAQAIQRHHRAQDRHHRRGRGLHLASATRDGLTLIAVILGAPSSAERFQAATALLDYGFAAYAAVPVPQLPDRPLELTVKGSTEQTVPLDYSALPQTVLLEKGAGADLRTELTLPETLEAPVERGQAVGTAAVYAGETLLAEAR